MVADFSTVFFLMVEEFRPPCVPEQNLCTDFLWTRCPSSHLLNKVKVVKGT